MNPSYRTSPGLRGRLWCACAVAVAALALISAPPASAQPDSRDPVEVFQDALEMDLNNLPGEDEMTRARTRKSILDYRQKVLDELAAKIVTSRDLSRVLRLRDSERLRDRKNKDLRLLDIDEGVYQGLLKRFVANFKKDAQSKDVLTQRATATLAGDLVSSVYSEQRRLIGDTVIISLLPELSRMADLPDPGIRIAVARAMGIIVLELDDILKRRSSELIRSTILRIQQSSDPEPRRAVIDTTGDLVRLFNPSAGEVSVRPKIATREDLLALLNLTPILFNGLRDSDAITRKKAINVLSRLNNLLARDRQFLILAPPLTPPPKGRTPTVEEVGFIKSNQDALRKELEDLHPRLEGFRTQTEVFEKALVDADSEIRLAALHILEDLATVQSYVRERVVSLPEDKKDDKSAAPAPGAYLEPLFEKVKPDLIKNLSDPNPRVRLAAVQVLENRGPAARHASNALIGRLDDANPFVRWVAARSLGRLNNPAAPGAAVALGKTLSDGDLSVRIAAANALELLGSEAGVAVPALVASVNSGDADYREAALKALGAAGPFVPATEIPREKRGAVIVPVLARELSSPDVTVRRAAALALGRFGADGGLAADALKKALADEDSEVRRYATEALLAK